MTNKYHAHAELIVENIISYFKDDGDEPVAVISVGEFSGDGFYPSYNLLLSNHNQEVVIHSGEEQSFTKQFFLDILAKDLEDSEAEGATEKYLTLMIFSSPFAMNVIKDIDNMAISYPDFTRMWTITEGTIQPTKNAAKYDWNGSDFNAGPALIDGEMDFYLEDGPLYDFISSADFSSSVDDTYSLPNRPARDEEVSDLIINGSVIKAESINRKVDYANSMVVEFLANVVFSQAKPGNHKISIRSSLGSHTTFFGVGEDETIYASTQVENFKLLLVTSVAFGVSAEVIVHSYLDEKVDEPEITNICRDESPQEVCGWLFSGDRIYSYSADQIIDIVCVDESTGKMISPPLNLSFKNGWSVGQ